MSMDSCYNLFVCRVCCTAGGWIACFCHGMVETSNVFRPPPHQFSSGTLGYNQPYTPTEETTLIPAPGSKGPTHFGAHSTSSSPHSSYDWLIVPATDYLFSWLQLHQLKLKLRWKNNEIDTVYLHLYRNMIIQVTITFVKWYHSSERSALHGIYLNYLHHASTIVVTTLFVIKPAKFYLSSYIII